MKSISSLIAVILILMIGVSLASFTYIFFAGVLSTTTEAGSETVEHISSSLLAEMRIESLTTAGIVTVKNTGKVNLTSFNVFVNGALDGDITAPPTIMPGGDGIIDLNNGLNSGDIVKVTSAQGTSAIKAVP